MSIAYTFRLRHRESLVEVSAVTYDGRTFFPDHGWGRGDLLWETHGSDVGAAVRREPSRFEVLSAMAMTVHDHAATPHMVTVTRGRVRSQPRA